MSAHVLAHPTAGNPPVQNNKRPGRNPKPVVSIARARMDRKIGELKRQTAPEPRDVAFPPAAPGTFRYPASTLLQAYFCQGGDGTWHEPRLDGAMLTDPKFVSPLGALLDQLEREGHDVAGARIEWMALREAVQMMKDHAMRVAVLASDAAYSKPLLATAAYVAKVTKPGSAT